MDDQNNKPADPSATPPAGSASDSTKPSAPVGAPMPPTTDSKTSPLDALIGDKPATPPVAGAPQPTPGSTMADTAGSDVLSNTASEPKKEDVSMPQPTPMAPPATTSSTPPTPAAPTMSTTDSAPQPQPAPTATPAPSTPQPTPANAPSPAGGTPVTPPTPPTGEEKKQLESAAKAIIKDLDQAKQANDAAKAAEAAAGGKPAESKKKMSTVAKAAAVGVLTMALGVGGYASMQLLQTPGTAENRSQAVEQCGTIVCKDGTSFGQDPNYQGGTCEARCNTACGGPENVSECNPYEPGAAAGGVDIVYSNNNKCIAANNQSGSGVYYAVKECVCSNAQGTACGDANGTCSTLSSGTLADKASTSTYCAGADVCTSKQIDIDVWRDSSLQEHLAGGGVIDHNYTASCDQAMSADFSAACAADQGTNGYNHTLTVSNIQNTSDGTVARIRWSLCGNPNIAAENSMKDTCMVDKNGNAVAPLYSGSGWFCYQFGQTIDVPEAQGATYQITESSTLTGAANAEVSVVDFTQCVTDNNFTGQLRAKANLLDNPGEPEFSTTESVVTLKHAACIEPTATPLPSPSVSPLACIDLSVSPASPLLGQTVSFECTGEGATYAEFRLGQNGQGYSELQRDTAYTASFTISEPGSYQVECRVCDDSGFTKQPVCTDYEELTG